MTRLMPMQFRIKLFLFALWFSLGFVIPATAADYAGAISAYRLAPLRKSRAAENIGAGFLSFSEMLKQWENSAGHRENLLMAGARRVGVASVDNPKSPYRKFWAMVITE